MKFRLEHRFPRRVRFAKVYFEAGSASISFSLDGTTADWWARIGRRKSLTQLSDKEYSRLRASVPATMIVDDDGMMVTVKNARGEEESWIRPSWTLSSLRSVEKDNLAE